MSNGVWFCPKCCFFPRHSHFTHLFVGVQCACSVPREPQGHVSFPSWRPAPLLRLDIHPHPPSRCSVLLLPPLLLSGPNNCRHLPSKHSGISPPPPQEPRYVSGASDMEPSLCYLWSRPYFLSSIVQTCPLWRFDVLGIGCNCSHPFGPGSFISKEDTPAPSCFPAPLTFRDQCLERPSQPGFRRALLSLFPWPLCFSPRVWIRFR